MTPTSVWCIATLFLILTNCDTKTVVFLPMEATSHVRTHAFVATKLAKLGHDVRLAVSSALYKRNVERYSGVTVFSYASELSEDKLIASTEATIADAINHGTDPDWTWMFSLESSLSEAYYKAMSQGQFIEYIEIMKPDFVIVDGFPYVDERVAIPYKLKIPFAVLTPIFDPTPFRMPVNPVAEAYNNRHIRTQGNFFEKYIVS